MGPRGYEKRDLGFPEAGCQESIIMPNAFVRLEGNIYLFNLLVTTRRKRAWNETKGNHCVHLYSRRKNKVRGIQLAIAFSGAGVRIV